MKSLWTDPLFGGIGLPVGSRIVPPLPPAPDAERDSVAAMLKLRTEGRSNAQIASILGRSPNKVYALIGKQPEELTLKRRADAWKRRKLVVTSSISR